MRKPTNKELTKRLQEAAARPHLTRGELVELRSRELIERKITAKEVADEQKLTDEEFRYCEIFTSLDRMGDKQGACIEAFNLNTDDPRVTTQANRIIARLDKSQPVMTVIILMRSC